MKACPRRFGRYILDHRIARGGMAEVYRAHTDDDPSFVAVKTIRSDLATDDEVLRLFAREARIVGQLRHPHIVRVDEIGAVEGTPYLVMEYLDGLDLMRLFRAVQGAGDGFPPVVATTLGHAVAKALAHAHAQREPIVHGDVTPHNVMLTRDGGIKLLDFGIAHHDSTPRRSRTTSIRGKLAYMSPEQARGEEVGPSTDVYALGLVLFELLCGRLWFRHRDRPTALAMVRRRAIPPLRHVAPAIPAALAEIVDRALQPRADARYPSAVPLVAALGDVLAHGLPAIDPDRLAKFVRRYHVPEVTRPTAARERLAPVALPPQTALERRPSDDAFGFEASAQRENQLRRYGQQRQRAAALRAMATGAATSEQRARAALARARFYIELPRLALAQATLAACEADTCPAPLRPWRAELAGALARRQGDLDGAEARLLAGLSRCEDDREGIRWRSRLLQGLALVHQRRGAADMAWACLEEALRQAEHIGAPRLCAAALTKQAELALAHHRYEEAIEWLRKAAQYDRALGDHHAGAMKLGRLGWAYAQLGLTSAAERALRHALRRLAPLGPPSELALLHARFGRVLAMTSSDAREIALHLSAAALLARRTGDDALARRMALAEAELALPSSAARSRCADVLRQARAADDPEVEARALDVLAAGEARTEIALVYATEAVAALRRSAPLWEAPRLLARLGALRETAGDPEGAATLVAEARELVARRHQALRDPRLAAAYLRLLRADPWLSPLSGPESASPSADYEGTRQSPIASASGLGAWPSSK